MKIFYPKHLYKNNQRNHLFPLLKPFIKGNNFLDKERIALYHVSDKDFQIEDELNNADIALLPMSWDYYYGLNKITEIEDFIKLAISYNLPVWSFTNGDFGVNAPEMDNLFIIRSNGYKSKLFKNNFGMPCFIDDPLDKIFNKKEIFKRDYNEGPIIGFCGQTNSSFVNAISEITKVVYRNLTYYVKITNKLPQKIQSTSFLRNKVLSKIEDSKVLATNFVKRKKYRAGASSKEERTKSTLDFYQNMIDSDYVVCIRGAGNFSVRFYETLAMGRIPIFINTDCLLPLSDKINWKKHVVWVEQNELNLIGDKVLEFHKSLTTEEFENLQQSNRRLWEESLTLGGYFKTQLNKK